MGKEVLLNLYRLDYNPESKTFTVLKPSYEIPKEKLNKVRWRVFLETGLPTFRRENEFWCAGKVKRGSIYIILSESEIIELKNTGEKSFEGFLNERECQELFRDYLTKTKVKENFLKDFYKEFRDRITVEGNKRKIAIIPEVNERVLKSDEGYFLLHVDFKFRILALETLQILLEKNNFNPIGMRVKPIGIDLVGRVKEVIKAAEKDEEFLKVCAQKSTHETSKNAWKELLENAELKQRAFLVVLDRGYIYPATMLKPVLAYEDLEEEEREEIVERVRIEPSARLKLIKHILGRYRSALGRYGWDISKNEEKAGGRIQFPNTVVDSRGFTEAIEKNLRGFLERCTPFTKKNSLDLEIISVAKDKDEKLGKKKTEFLKNLKYFLQNKGINLHIKKVHPILAETREKAKEGLIPVLSQIKDVDLVLVFLEEYPKIDPYKNFLLYDFVKQELLKRMIPSQVVLNKTLKKENLRFVLLNVAEQVLAKTGNIPYRLKEVEGEVDAFVGIDVSRITKDGKTVNTVAFTKVFNSKGELVRYYLTSYPAFGEKLTEKVINDVFSLLKKLGFGSGSKFVIHRDGRFFRDEVEAFLKFAGAYDYSLELVEIIKRNNPRFFSKERFIKGYFYKLADGSLILASYNQIYEGTHQPIRVRKVYGELPVEVLASQILSLTLMNYSSFQPIKLPATVHYSDKITKLMLRGIEPIRKEGNIMYWL